MPLQSREPEPLTDCLIYGHKWGPCGYGDGAWERCANCLLVERPPRQIPIFIDTYYWGDLGLEERPVTELVANTEPWLLAPVLGPYYYSSRDCTYGAPWPSDADCAEVTYETLG